MTQEEQRVAIAEACGWIMETQEFFGWKGSRGTGYRWTHPEHGVATGVGGGCYGHGFLSRPSTINLPDYLHDLNAIAEAEFGLIYVDDEIDTDLISDYLLNLVISSKAGRSQSATAAERSKAILLTIGKWKEGESE